jgi:glutamyl/glutaminyl-tRNA synthetase
MNFNFGQARIAQEQGFGGETIMRFDDTNPEVL